MIIKPNAKGKALVSASLAAHGSRLQFGVAIALISIVPLLTLFYMFQSYSSGEIISEVRMAVVGAFLTCTVCLGYALLLKYPRTLMRLRGHLENIARGELPNSIDLLAEESDTSSIETYFNLIIARMRKRIETIEAQGKQLVVAERQRVMAESLCTACHCLGQPATTIGCYLDLLKTELLSSAGDEHLAHCIDEASRMRDILLELQSISVYSTEPYCVLSEQQEEAPPRIIRLSSDKATRRPTVREEFCAAAQIMEPALAAS